MKDIEIRLAEKGDLPGIQSLLATFDLPVDDAGEHLGSFLVAKRGTDILGTVGLEIYGASALLRSLAVREAHRNKGIARSLYDRLVALALEKGIREISLLTTTAEGYFARLGFQRVPQEKIPDYVKQTKEYRFYCPSNAVCMVKKI